VASTIQCRDLEHLEKIFQDIIEGGGEGIILRDPQSLYSPGRSRGFLKHKVLFISFHCWNTSVPQTNNLFSKSEISGWWSKDCWQTKSIPMGMRTVIFFLSPHFNLQCSLSHLFSKQTHISSYRPNGVRFVAPAGTSEFLKRWDPIIGDIVSFKHHGFMFATQKPKSPMLFRVRSDLTWDQVLDHWKQQKPSISGLFFFLFYFYFPD